VFPGAVEWTGAAPGLPRLVDVARPGGDPFQEFDRQKLGFARHDRPASRRCDGHLQEVRLAECIPLVQYMISRLFISIEYRIWSCATFAISSRSPRRAM